MNLIFKKASVADIDVLTELRIKVLRAANRLADDVDMTLVKKESYRYYQHCFDRDEHAAYLAYDQDKIVGCGGVSFYQVMPTYGNPYGTNAYIMNMYTEPDYRGNGIASAILDLLVREAQKRAIQKISLEATAMGRPVYLKYGFVEMKDEMEYQPV